MERSSQSPAPINQNDCLNLSCFFSLSRSSSLCRPSLYLVLAVAAAAAWFFSPAETKFATTPLVFALGALTLLAKGIFLLRRSSEGLGLNQSDLAALSDPANRKQLPPIPAQAAQILQDFAAVPLLLWPILNAAKDIDQSRSDPPRLQVFAAGAILFALGWTIRRLTTATR